MQLGHTDLSCTMGSCSCCKSIAKVVSALLELLTAEWMCAGGRSAPHGSSADGQQPGHAAGRHATGNAIRHGTGPPSHRAHSTTPGPSDGQADGQTPPQAPDHCRHVPGRPAGEPSLMHKPTRGCNGMLCKRIPSCPIIFCKAAVLT